MERLLSDMPPAVCVKVEDSFYKVISEISSRTFGALQYFFHLNNKAIIKKIPARSGVGGQGDINVSYWSSTVAILVVDSPATSQSTPALSPSNFSLRCVNKDICFFIVEKRFP
jgi:hypothetical protein